LVYTENTKQTHTLLTQNTNFINIDKNTVRSATTVKTDCQIEHFAATKLIKQR